MHPDEDATSIGNILLRLGYCQPNDISTALARVNGTKLLGEVLVDMGAVSRPQLEWASQYQRMERGEVNPADILREQRTAFFEEADAVNKTTRELTGRMRIKTSS